MSCARVFVYPQVKFGDNDLIITAFIVEYRVIVGGHYHLAPSVTVEG